MSCLYKSLLQLSTSRAYSQVHPAMQTKNSVQKKRADLKVGPYEIFLF